MLNNREHRAIGVFIAWVPTLRSVASVIKRVQIAAQPRHGGQHTHTNSGLVHHVEHVFEAFVYLPYQIAKAITALAEVQQRVGGAPLSHLVVEARERNVIQLR